MLPEYKLSLPAAVLINVNIMLGVGIFMNTSLLAQQTGALGFLNYLLVGILLLPLVLSVAKLLELHPAGGFFTFAQQELSVGWGFISAWTYFTGKLASGTIMIHTSVLILQKLFSSLAAISPLLLDGIILTLFIGLNTLNLKAGRNIQIMFTIFKAVPIFFVIASGIYLFNGTNFLSNQQLWEGIPTTLPLVIYAAMGFEAAASISSKIENARKNAPRAVLISYGIIICILTVYQLLFYGSLGSLLGQGTYREAFPNLLNQVFSTDPLFANKVSGLINLAIASSALGGSYGILFSNSWNLHVLAQNKLLVGSSFFARLNKHAIPFICVFTEGIICAIYLCLTGGNQVLLQTISAFAAVTTYSICAVSLAAAKYNRPEITINRWIPLLGTVNCLILASACVYNLFTKGITGLWGFLALIVIGVLMYLSTTYSRRS